MPTIFRRKTTASDEHANMLVTLQVNGTVFQAEPDTHEILLINCSIAVKEKLFILQQIDQKMAIGFALGAAALVLSWIFAISILATAALIYGAVQYGYRQQAYKEYNEALENLRNCCEWSLGEGQVQDKSVVNHPAVREMMTTLYPLMDEPTLRLLIDDEVEQAFIDEHQRLAADGLDVGQTHLDKEQATLYFKIYGYGQGGPFAILEVIGYAIKNVAIVAKNLFTGNTAEVEQPRNQAPL